MRKTLVGSVLFTLATAATLHAQDLDIQQVPSTARPTSNDAESMIKATDQDSGGNYQTQILSDPELNDHARAEAVINTDTNKKTETLDAKAAGGNTATIIQNGKANTSSIVQTGDNNTAVQTQTGQHNDLRVEQVGKNNVSEENQTGEYNHKVKIQNGEKSEEFEIDKNSPDSYGKD